VFQNFHARAQAAAPNSLQSARTSPDPAAIYKHPDFRAASEEQRAAMIKGLPKDRSSNSGAPAAPARAQIASPAPAEEPPLGILDRIKEQFTGDRRATDVTRRFEDWTSLPEYTGWDSAAKLKMKIGTLTAGPEEIAKIITANAPGVEVYQDEKDNYFFRSGVNGKYYAIKPGFQKSDIGRGIATTALMAPMAIPGVGPVGAAGLAMLGEAGLQASQGATGGDFDTSDVMLAGGLTGGLGYLGQGAKYAGKKIAGSPVGQKATGWLQGKAGDLARRLDTPSPARPLMSTEPDHGVQPWVAQFKKGFFGEQDPNAAGGLRAAVERLRPLMSTGPDATAVELFRQPLPAGLGPKTTGRLRNALAAWPDPEAAKPLMLTGPNLESDLVFARPAAKAKGPILAARPAAKVSGRLEEIRRLVAAEPDPKAKGRISTGWPDPEAGERLEEIRRSLAAKPATKAADRLKAEEEEEAERILRRLIPTLTPKKPKAKPSSGQASAR